MHPCISTPTRFTCLYVASSSLFGLTGDTITEGAQPLHKQVSAEATLIMQLPAVTRLSQSNRKCSGYDENHARRALYTVLCFLYISVQHQSWGHMHACQTIIDILVLILCKPLIFKYYNNKIRTKVYIKCMVY